MKNKIIKRIVIINVLLLAFIIVGCSKQSVTDTYEMLSMANEGNAIASTLSAEVASAKSQHVFYGNQYSDLSANINKIPFGSSAVVENKASKVKITIAVEDILIANNFFDIKKLTDETSTNNLFNYLMNYDNENICNADGTINPGKYGTDRCALFVKLKIKNESNVESDIGLSALKLYNMKNENGKLQYSQLSEQCNGIDKIQNYNSHFDFYKFQPNETQEIVLFFPIENELVTEYSYEFNGNTKVPTNVKTNGTSMFDVYMNTNLSGVTPEFTDNMNVFKLNIENGVFKK